MTVPGGEGTKPDGPPVVDVPKSEMIEQCKGWEPEILGLIGVRANPLRD